MTSEDELEELRTICMDAKPMTDGPLQLIHLVDLAISLKPEGILIMPESLICLSNHNGYSTRIFLSKPVPRPLNWSIETILGKAWHTWSWQGVPAEQRPAQILAQHFMAFHKC